MRKSIEDKILAVFDQKTDQTLSMQEIAKELDLQSSKAFKGLVQAVAELERREVLKFTKNGKIKQSNTESVLEGIFQANERGFGFVTIDSEETDIYIAKEHTGFAMDGDTVTIEITKSSNLVDDRGAEGKVTAIKKRAIQDLVGEFAAFSEEKKLATDLYGVVVPKDRKLKNFEVLIAAEGICPIDGSVVKVTITHYPEPGYPKKLEGIVTFVIGHKDEPGMDILSIVTAKGIPNKFPDEVLAEAAKIPEKIDPADYPDRRDLRQQTTVTIDGADAKDLDDAVTVSKLDNGNFFLGVHIADVSYYVTAGSQLDQEAFARGTSVYLTDRVIPMIPQRLSNGICSLNPHTPRLTMSCQMEIDQNGQVVAYEIFPSMIETTERMTYFSVNQILEENDPKMCERYENLVPMFQEMAELHYVLEKMRTKRGAVSFEDKEAEIIVDSNGHPLDIQLRTRGTGEKMIESFMLVANETVAKHFNQKQLPFLYRIHEEPKEEKLQTFFDFASALGILVKQTKGTIRPKDLQQVLLVAAPKPEAMVINMMLLRSMQQAKYSEENLGHYGLAAEYYTHFTSPIRRYPDLIVHRLIRSYEVDRSKQNQAKWAERLPDIAIQSSQMERRAVDAEREVDAMKKAEFMADHVGEIYEGIISSVVKFGLFIELPNTVEGLVHISTIVDDYYNFYEAQLALIGEHTHHMFKIGQKVRVKVVKADPLTREIDFELVNDEKKDRHKAIHKKKNKAQNNKKGSENVSKTKKNSPSRKKKRLKQKKSPKRLKNKGERADRERE